MSEQATASFRTSVGGFHKGDVTDYIARTAQAHEARVTELQARLDALEEENSRLRALLAEQPTPEEAPEEPSPREPEDSIARQELAAYRRAEAAERLAAQRVRKLYGDMQDVCDRSTRQAEASRAAAQEAMEILDKQLEVLRISAAALRDGLSTSAEELSAMSSFVPDPAEVLEL